MNARTVLCFAVAWLMLLAVVVVHRNATAPAVVKNGAWSCPDGYVLEHNGNSPLWERENAVRCIRP